MEVQELELQVPAEAVQEVKELSLTELGWVGGGTGAFLNDV